MHKSLVREERYSIVDDEDCLKRTARANDNADISGQQGQEVRDRVADVHYAALCLAP